MHAILMFLVLAADPPPPLVPTPKLPASVQVNVGRIATVQMESTATHFRWRQVGDAADVFREYDPAPGRVTLRVLGAKQGVVYLVCCAGQDGQLSEIGVCAVQVGGPAPDPGPGPGPTPTPTPTTKAKVLIVVETRDLSKMPQAQAAGLLSLDLRKWLDENCEPSADGQTKAWRMWDQDIDATNGPAWHQAALKRKRDSLPWIVIESGKGLYEGPLPGNLGEMLDLLKNKGGK